MKQAFPVISIILDKRRSKENNLFPLKLRITFKGERKYYSTGFNASLSDWETMETKNVRGALKNIYHSINEIKIRAQRCCNSLSSFSFQAFETAFFPKSIPTTTVQIAYDQYISKIKQNEQIGTSHSYRNACISLHKFKPNLKFKHITVEFLKNYEYWFLQRGNSITTVGIYLRSLRAIINVAIENGVMEHADYPFGSRKYSIPIGRNIKKALSIEV